MCSNHMHFTLHEITFFIFDVDLDQGADLYLVFCIFSTYFLKLQASLRDRYLCFCVDQKNMDLNNLHVVSYRALEEQPVVYYGI